MLKLKLNKFFVRKVKHTRVSQFLSLVSLKRINPYRTTYFQVVLKVQTTTNHNNVKNVPSCIVTGSQRSVLSKKIQAPNRGASH